MVLSHLTTHHTEPDMTETFAVLHRHMASADASPHKYTAGRKSKYDIPDLIDRGLATLMKGGNGYTQGETDGVEEEIIPDIGDISVDLALL